MTDLAFTPAQLIQDRPPNWAYRLAALWLREELARADQQLVDLKRGAIFRPSTALTPSEFSRWAKQKIATMLTDDLNLACGDAQSKPDNLRGSGQDEVPRLAKLLMNLNLVLWSNSLCLTL